MAEIGIRQTLSLSDAKKWTEDVLKLTAFGKKFISHFGLELHWFQVPIKFYKVIKTTEYSSWVVQTRAKEIQIQDFVFTAYLQDM